MENVSGGIYTADETTEYTASEILEFLSQSGKIDFEDVEKAMRKAKIDRIIHNKHHYKIYQSKDGRWNTYISDPNSKYRRKRIVKATRDELEEFLYSFYASQDETVKKRRITLRQLYPEWLEHKRLHTDAETYLIRIGYEWKRFYEDSSIVDIPIRKLDKLTLDEWIHQIVKAEHLTAKRYYSMSIILRQALDFAVDKGIIDKNPFKTVKVERRLFAANVKKSGETQVFSIEETSSIKELAWNDFIHGNHPIQPLIPLAVLFVFQEGIRLGEICSLRYSDITPDGNTIIVSSMFRRKTSEIVSHTKGTYGDRAIPLTDEAKFIISLAREKQREHNVSSDGFIFSCMPTPIGYETLEKVIAKYCEMMGIGRKSPHTIRRTWVSTLLDDGINPDTVRRLAGHKDLQTTYDNYYFDRHSSDENRDKMNRALSSI